MSTTTSTYLAVTQNLARYQTMTAEAAGRDDRDRLLQGEYRFGEVGEPISSRTIGCCPMRSRPMGSATRSIPRRWSRKCSRAASAIPRASPTRCPIQPGKPSQTRSTSPIRELRRLRRQFGDDDDGRLRRTTIGERRGPTGPRRAARAVFSTRRPDRNQFLWNSGQREFAGSRADDLRARVDHHFLPDRRRGEQPSASRAGLRTAGPYEGEAAGRAFQGGVRCEIRADFGILLVADRRRRIATARFPPLRVSWPAS